MTGIIFSLYLLGVLPILLGAFVRTVQRVSGARLCELYAVGYASLFAAAAPFMIIAVERDMAPSEAVSYFIPAALAIGAVCLVFGFGKLRTAISSGIMAFHEGDFHRMRLIADVLWIVMTALSVLFIMPKTSDTTIATVNTAAAFDSFYGRDIFTKESLDVVLPNHSPLEAFYTLMALSSGIAGDIFMTRILAAFMLISAGCVYAYAAGVLFSDDRAGEWFRLAALLIFAVEVVRDGRMETALFMNVWNGLTYAASVLFPLAFVECIRLCRGIKTAERKALSLWAAFVGMMIFAVAAQLLTHQAGGIMVFMWIVLLVISYVA